MIQIRHGVYETNSSSANVLIIPKEQNAHVPQKLYFMDDDTSRKPTELILCRLFAYGFIDEIINFLYLNGVEEIVYGGSNGKIINAIERYKNKPQDLGLPKGWEKEKLLKALFGYSTEVEHFGDGDRRPTWQEDDNGKWGHVDEDWENWYEEFYTDD